MKAKDTVMDRDRMLGCSLRGKYCFDEVKDVILDTAIAQAEITGKIMYQAGYKAKEGEFEVAQIALSEVYDTGEAAGMRKVVEWIMANTTEDELHFRSFNDARQWQAKLKEWGINNGC